MLAGGVVVAMNTQPSVKGLRYQLNNCQVSFLLTQQKFMSFVKEILTPIVSMTVLVGFLTGLGWLLYRGLNKLMPDLNSWLKYNVLKRKMNVETIKWCYDRIKRDMSSIDIEMLLLQKDFPPKRIADTLYIFKAVKKELEGGVEDE